MRLVAVIFVQNYADWGRYEAEERGEKVPARPVISDRSIFLEEINIARIADDTGFFAREIMPALKELAPAPMQPAGV